MGIAETNRIVELETKVAKLIEQMQQLQAQLKQHPPEKRGPGRPRLTGHMQPQ